MEEKEEFQAKKKLPYKIIFADNFVTRLKGLMFRKEPLVNEGLWIKPCNSIHTFFMNFPIDVVFMDGDLKVVRTVEDVKPRKLIFPVKKAKTTLELPAGTIKKFTIKEGDTLDL